MARTDTLETPRSANRRSAAASRRSRVSEGTESSAASGVVAVSGFLAAMVANHTTILNGCAIRMGKLQSDCDGTRTAHIKKTYASTPATFLK